MLFLALVRHGNGLSERFIETKKLFEFAYNNYFLRTVREANSVVETTVIKNGTKDTKNLDVEIKDKIVALVDKDSLYSNLPSDVKINKNLKAPISKGDVIGKINYTINGINYSSDLIAGSNVEKSYLFIVVLGILIFVFIIMVLFLRIWFKLHRNSKKSRYKHYRI